MTDTPELMGTPPDKTRRSKAGIDARKVATAARQRAYKALARLYPEKYRELFDAEKRAAGWVPGHRGRPRGETA